MTNVIVKQLEEAGVTYTIKRVFSDFHGTQYNFPNVKEARKAEKATGQCVLGKLNNLHFTVY